MSVRQKKPRTCVACRKESPKRGLLRIVRTPEGKIEIDPTGRKAGRGAYLCLDENCLDSARKKDSLSKALRVKVHPDLYDDILALLASRNDSEKNNG